MYNLGYLRKVLASEDIRGLSDDTLVCVQDEQGRAFDLSSLWVDTGKNTEDHRTENHKNTPVVVICSDFPSELETVYTETCLYS